MLEFLNQHFSISLNGFSQSWAFWALIEAAIIVWLLVLLAKKKK